MTQITTRLSVKEPDADGIREMIVRDCGDTVDGTEILWLTRAEADALIAALNPWRPIANAPKMQMILLFAVTHINDDGTVGNWKKATGSWHTGYEDERSRANGFTPWNWDGRQLKSYDVQPTHWMPLPPSPPSPDAGQATDGGAK